MSIQNTDFFLVSRNNINYKVEAEDIGFAQDTDLFLVERENIKYKIKKQDIGFAQDTDLFLVERSGANYKVESSKLKDYLFVGTYPVMGTLYVPDTNKVPNSLDVIVAFHGTLPSDGTETIETASKTILGDIKFDVNIKDKIIFSVPYPQDKIDQSRQYNLSGTGNENPNFLIEDGIVYARASLRWVKTSLNSYMASQGISKTINNVYVFGHSQGGYVSLKLNTLEETDGVVMSAPGPLRLDLVCEIQQTNNPPAGFETCEKIYNIYGSASSNPSTYLSRSGASYTNGHKAPMLFLQAQDDDTALNQQYNYLVDVVSDIQSNTNPGVTTSYVLTGGHTAYKTDNTQKAAFRSFVNSDVSISNTITSGDIQQITIVPSDGYTQSL